ncbi:MAG: hypothetical protein JST45_09785 [Bacteroidetes bacterium]|nr:hypothetical protein [Bacteroidota bacterium]
MEEDLKKNLLLVCSEFQRNEVQYLLVGGVAVALHGYYRHSMGPMGQLTSKPDIDLWFDPLNSRERPRSCALHQLCRGQGHGLPRTCNVHS